MQLYASTDTRIGNSDDRLVETTVTDSKGNYRLLVNRRDAVLSGLRPPGWSVVCQTGPTSGADSTGTTALFALSAGGTIARNIALTGTATAFGWAVGATTSTSTGNAVTTDNAGNVYVAGSFSGKLTLGSGASSQVLTAQGTQDGFVAKYTAAGALVWVRDVGGSRARTPPWPSPWMPARTSTSPVHSRARVTWGL